jgi:hypothetical protein
VSVRLPQLRVFAFVFVHPHRLRPSIRIDCVRPWGCVVAQVCCQSVSLAVASTNVCHLMIHFVFCFSPSSSLFLILFDQVLLYGGWGLDSTNQLNYLGDLWVLTTPN